MKPLRILVGAAALSLALPLTAQAAPNALDRFQRTDRTGVIDTDFKPSLTNPNKQVHVIVELTADPVSVAQAKAGRKFNKNEKANLRAALKKSQGNVTAKVKAGGGKVIAEMQDAINGVHAYVKASEVAKLAAQPGVKSVHGVTTYKRNNAVAAPYLGLPSVWQSQGYTGKGVKIGIIDTGIDYTHADFAGPGSVAAYEAADANDTKLDATDAMWFGPKAPRVKGGIDLVGDDYDPNKEGSLPVPDPDPLDCQGHGSHVAGSAAGGGVLADGTAYTGPYTKATESQKWTIGPGSAPEADLYGIRVFGCDGSTNVVVEAINWAVANEMDVINMSLGSPYGRASDADAIAASNAVAAGTVVVASAGNSGPNPYLTGSPAAAPGVISVAAIDSTKEFPGAALTFDGQTIQAINANESTLPTTPFTIKVIKENGDVSLGCTTEAFTQAGIKPGLNQIAVVKRGQCARVAKAVWGQKAGAAAVIMVNTSTDYPPVEGPITENPDNGEQYAVTIPFLGVRGLLGTAATDDGDALVAADGKELTLAPTTIPNPGYTKASSFTSGGARSGDSGAKPNVASPGVSIVSAGVGTGNQPVTMSGTSMASPLAAGAAALVVQAHPTWTANEVAANIVNAADPEKVGDYRLTLTGTGLVDAAQSVTSKSYAYGDTAKTPSGKVFEPTISYGFVQSTTAYTGSQQVTIVNKSNKAITYQISTEASPQSVKASVKLNKKSITVPAGKSRKVAAQLTVPMASVPSSLSNEDFTFWEASGHVVIKGGGETLRVAYLAVPRANSDVRASGTLASGAVNLTNYGKIAGTADLYQWGLQDAADENSRSGIDIRAVGVQSFDLGDDQLLVFAINNWDRFSNPASNEYDVAVDLNHDGEFDSAIFAVDSGLVRAGDADGYDEVFVQTPAGKLISSGFLASAPTDSSTVLLPVMASDLGITKDVGTFSYAAASYSLSDDTLYDVTDEVARYNPWMPAVENGQAEVLKGGESVSIPVKVDAKAAADQKPLGSMVVSMDNATGAPEALLVGMK